jgi:hypothetical protein
MAAKRVCAQCGAKRFKKDSNGSLFCRNGHQLDELEEITEDAGNLVGTTRRARAKGRKSKYERKKGPPRIYMTVIQLQNLLQSQIWWLEDKQKVPHEFEKIIKDLWFIWLSSLNVDPKQHSQARVKFQLENLTASLSVIFCHLGCIILHLPYFIQDFRNWIIHDNFPYIFALNRDVGIVPVLRIFESETMIEKETLMIKQLHELDLKIPSFDHPLLAGRLFKALELDESLYIIFKKMMIMLENDEKSSSFKVGSKSISLSPIKYGLTTCAICLVLTKLYTRTERLFLF